MNSRRQPVANERGQLILEAVLIIVALMAVTGLVASSFKKNEFLRQMISGPWVNLAGMLQNGVWAPADSGTAVHPNSHSRNIVQVGEEAR